MTDSDSAVFLSAKTVNTDDNIAENISATASITNWEQDRKGHQLPDPLSSSGSLVQSPHRIDINLRSTLRIQSVSHSHQTGPSHPMSESTSPVPCLSPTSSLGRAPDEGKSLQVKSKNQDNVMTSIGAFSADAQWKPSFLLAPVKAVSLHNKANMYNVLERWDPIGVPPVLVHPNAKDTDICVDLPSGKFQNSNNNIPATPASFAVSPITPSPASLPLLDDNQELLTPPDTAQATTGVIYGGNEMTDTVGNADDDIDENEDDEDDVSSKSTIVFINDGMHLEDNQPPRPVTAVQEICSNWSSVKQPESRSGFFSSI